VDGATLGPDAEGAAWSPALPAVGDAALRVDVEGRPPFFFPVGATEDGEREVDVVLPAPRRVVLPPGAREAVLHDGEREAYAFREEGALLTDASGLLTLRWEDAAGRALEARIHVPAEEGARVEVPASAGVPVVAEVTVRAVGRRLAPGENADEDVETEQPGETVLFQREGWRTLRAVAPAEGETVLSWGPAALRLEIVEEDGAPVDAIVLAGGEVYAAPAGVLALEGFDAGPLRVLVARRDVVGEGRELHLVLEPGANAPRRVVLPD
jgi:hypothetical protein